MTTPINTLLRLMAALRDPERGCPWDVAQSFASVAPYTIEEAYEVADAIERGDFADLKEELGDLLLQVVFHARLAEERDLFGFADVVEAISAKLIRRHPHVFGDRRGLDADGVKSLWDEIKQAEKADRRRSSSEPVETDAGALAGIPVALPALMRADKIGRRAAKTGFDWQDAPEVIAKVREELEEIEGALARGSIGEIREEVGDALFAMANLARYLRIDPEAALRSANAKFVRRFRLMERFAAAQGRAISDLDMATLDELWREAKREAGGGEPPADQA